MEQFDFKFSVVGYYPGYIVPIIVIKMALQDSLMEAVETKYQLEKDFRELTFTILRKCL